MTVADALGFEWLSVASVAALAGIPEERAEAELARLKDAGEARSSAGYWRRRR